MYTISVSEFDESGEGTTRLWFLDEETMRSLEADLTAKFGAAMAEGLSPSTDEPTIVLLAEPS